MPTNTLETYTFRRKCGCGGEIKVPKGPGVIEASAARGLVPVCRDAIVERKLLLKKKMALDWNPEIEAWYRREIEAELDRGK